jgi:hypothetical protein
MRVADMHGFNRSDVDRPGAADSGHAPSAATTEALLTLRGRPIRFLLHFAAKHPWSHVAVLSAVLVAVLCSVLTQYGLRDLVDAISHGHGAAAVRGVWIAFAVLAVLIGADNLMWRVGGWIAASLFVRVTGDVRRDLFNHLAGHAPSYFADRLPGTLAGRVTATANAIFTTRGGGHLLYCPCDLGEPGHGRDHVRHQRGPRHRHLFPRPPRRAASPQLCGHGGACRW